QPKLPPTSAVVWRAKVTLRNRGSRISAPLTARTSTLPGNGVARDERVTTLIAKATGTTSSTRHNTTCHSAASNSAPTERAWAGVAPVNRRSNNNSTSLSTDSNGTLVSTSNQGNSGEPT